MPPSHILVTDFFGGVAGVEVASPVRKSANGGRGWTAATSEQQKSNRDTKLLRNVDKPRPSSNITLSPPASLPIRDLVGWVALAGAAATGAYAYTRALGH